MLKKIIVCFLLVISILQVTSCSSPCKELAEKICDCVETSASARSRCLELHLARMKGDDSEKVCTSALSNSKCNCEALRLGPKNDPKQCGLTNEDIEQGQQ